MLPSLAIKEVLGNIGVDIIGGTILAIRPLAMSRNPLRLRKDILFRSWRRYFHTKLCHDALLTASSFLLCHIGVIHALLNIQLEAEGLLYLDLEFGVPRGLEHGIICGVSRRPPKGHMRSKTIKESNASKPAISPAISGRICRTCWRRC
jgi:hypothetical protein